MQERVPYESIFVENYDNEKIVETKSAAMIRKIMIDRRKNRGKSQRTAIHSRGYLLDCRTMQTNQEKLT